MRGCDGIGGQRRDCRREAHHGGLYSPRPRVGLYYQSNRKPSKSLGTEVK